MSNKKRISKRVKSIQDKHNMKRLSFMCSWLVECIKFAQEVSMGLRKVSERYPSGVFTTNNGEPEKIINASQKIIKENPNYNKFTIKDKDFGSATYNIYEEGPEKIIDSHGDEMILPKFEVKHNQYFLHTHKTEQS